MVAAIYAGILATIYGGLYYYNHKTPLPKGMEKLKADCKGCKNYGCGHYSLQNIKGDTYD